MSRSPRTEAGPPTRRSSTPERVALCVAVGVLVSCGMGDEPRRLHSTHPPPVSSGSVTVEARQPMLPMYPCSRCHAGRPPDTTERKLTELHSQKVLHHGEQKGWCYRCHGRDDVDKLHKGDGTLVSFDEAYELCGSCHGDKFRDWRAGIHGLTTGYWLGDRLRRSCPSCHDPHDPAFPHMTPEKAPARPRTAPAEDPHPRPEGGGGAEKSHGEKH